MISSEVQRTLVKSPPELWTELSDPESLARHLGDLGEIRITRTEPENLVEWEAEGTTGTVEIAPSGWGTRVKLTVARELPAEFGEEPASSVETPDGAAETPDDAAETAESAAETPDDAVETAESAAETLAAAAETAARAAETAGGDLAVAGGDAEAQAADLAPAADAAPPPFPARAEIASDAESPGAEKTLDGESAPEAAIGGRKPAPATEAARRAAGWPVGGHTPGPAIESDLRAAEALEGAPAQPDGMHEWAAQTIGPAETRLDDEADPNDEHAPAEEPQPPKRGLFARLFGRRRGRAKPAPLEEPALDAFVFAGAGEPSMENEAFDEPDETVPADTGTAGTGLDTEAVEQVEVIAGEPGRTTASEDAGHEHAEPSLCADPEPAHTEPSLLAEPAMPEPALDPLPRIAMTEPGGGEQALAAPQTGTPASGGEPPAAETAQPVTPVEDLAAELRAAEQVDAERVEAVLTAVLDRLGSAHHRPFSRP